MNNPGNPTSLKDDIDRLVAAQGAPSTAEVDALAVSLADSLVDTPLAESPAVRALAVRGLMAAQRQRYRTGHLAHCQQILSAALRLCAGLDPQTHVSVRLRCGNFGLLQFDIGAALEHTAAAIEIARTHDLPLEEAYAAADYGHALQSAGLCRQADACLAEALLLAARQDDPHLTGNIWALRFGCRLERDDFDGAARACEEALACSRDCPDMARDAMACTAWCNQAVLKMLQGDVGGARASLRNAAALPNLGVRPKWLIDAIAAMIEVRIENSAGNRRVLDDLLLPSNAPVRTYVIETYSIMARLFYRINDPRHACDALNRLAGERIGALSALMRGPGLVHGAAATGRPALAPPRTSAPLADEASMGRLVRLAVTAELRDDATGRHCFRVGQLSLLLARRAGLPGELLAHIDVAARLHDIGKIAIPDAILLKPAKLSADEMDLMRTHTTVGADLLGGGEAPLLRAAEQIARHHHEYWNGDGYPLCLAGEAIPLVARVTALADVFDALTHVRPYKRAWPRDEALDYIARLRGVQFDPLLTDVFLALMRDAENDWAAFYDLLEGAAIDFAFVASQVRAAHSLEEDTRVLRETDARAG